MTKAARKGTTVAFSPARRPMRALERVAAWARTRSAASPRAMAARRSRKPASTSRVPAGVPRPQARLERLEALEVGVDDQAVRLAGAAGGVGRHGLAQHRARAVDADPGGRLREGRLAPGVDEAASRGRDGPPARSTESTSRSVREARSARVMATGPAPVSPSWPEVEDVEGQAPAIGGGAGRRSWPWPCPARRRSARCRRGRATGRRAGSGSLKRDGRGIEGLRARAVSPSPLGPWHSVQPWA